MAKDIEKTTPRGKARFEIYDGGEMVSVRLDRPGFRRLLQTLQELAETGEPQAFEKSGRGTGQRRADPQKLVFHIDAK